MRSIVVALAVLLLSNVSFTEELHRAKTLFSARNFKFVYSYEDRLLIFKNNDNKNIGTYPSKLRLSLLENDQEKQYNTVLEYENSEILITQWENGKFFNIRAFIPSSNTLPVSLDKPFCEVSVVGEPFNWKTDKERVAIEKLNNHLQIRFTRNSGIVEICK